MGLTLNLYTFPQDIYDQVGTEGGQLRLDDHQLATGQRIAVTAAAAQGATSLSVTPLHYPLLAGTVLEMDGGGMPAVVEVTLSAVAQVGATTLSVNPLSAAVNATAAAQDSGVNLATAQRLVKACQFGTSQVKLYCTNRYDDSDLQANALENGSVKRWATALGARWLCRRRGQTAPKSVDAQAEESLEELRQVKVGMLCIEDIGTRTAGWPFMSNVTVDIGYTVRKVRVEQQISELTPTQYPQSVDWASIFLLEI